MEGNNMMILPVSLFVAGGAVLINTWLGIRIGQVRTREKISIGDGGNESLIRRMRAQANFIEFTPIILVLFALVELACGTCTLLWVAAALYLLGRVAHAIGMDGVGKARMVGTLISMLTGIGLGLFALYTAFTAHNIVTAPAADEPVSEAVPQG
jgi:uncharacterized protein